MTLYNQFLTPGLPFSFSLCSWMYKERRCVWMGLDRLLPLLNCTVPYWPFLHFSCLLVLLLYAAKKPASISSRSVKELMPIVIDLWVPRTYQLFNTWKRWLLCRKYIYSIICLMAFPFFQVFLFLMDSLTPLPFGCKWAPYRISRISAMNNVSPSF